MEEGAHPKLNRPGSIGLGLYIAREVAHSHGGSIDVTSTREAGTAFTVRLPPHNPHEPAQPILDENHVQSMRSRSNLAAPSSLTH